MRTPHLHIPHFAWPHLSRLSFALPFRARTGRLPKLPQRPLRLADMLALVLAGTLAAAVAVALLMSI